MTAQRELDLVLYGATGFTGGLVAEHLAETAQPGALRWAIAGRNEDKLKRVRKGLTQKNQAWVDLPLVVASSDDPNSMRALAERTKVVATTVGPFALHGEPVVAACVDACTDYVDITGEPAFWWRIIERYHDRAAERGVLIVPCCGFDSIPHDMGVLFTLGALGANDAPVRIRGYVSVTGRPSGGTWSSAVHAMTGLRTMKRARPARTSQPHERPRVHRVPELERWAVPLPTIDPLVVKRSAEFSPAFPEAFTYLHYLQTRSVWSVGKLAAGAGVVAGLAQWKPTRDLLLRMQPSGTGPSAEERARGRFRVTFLAEAGGKRLRTQVSGHDPGYEHTSKMLAAAALTLVEDRDALPHRGGVLTPASALAGPLMPRLADTGMRFDIQDR